MNYEQTQNLKNYIKQQIQSGVESDQITAQLANAGWDPNLTQPAFQQVLAEMAPAAPAAVAPQPAAAPITAGDFVFQPPQPATLHPGTTKAGMFKRIGIGWLLFKQSLVVLRGNRYLLRYLWMTYLWVFVITIFFFVLYLIGRATVLNASVDSQGFTTLIGYIVLFFNYLLVYFAINYYAAGLTANMVDIFSGKKQPYEVYMSAARSRVGTIFVLSLFSATVGIALRYIFERLGWVGTIIQWLLGTAWSLATMFTLPIIITTNSSAPASVKQSIKLLKSTWGESLSAKVSVNAPLLLVNLIVLIVGIFIINVLVGVAGIVGFIIGVILLLIVQLTVAIIGSFANSLVNTAVYYYAAYRLVPAAFDESLLNQIFVERKRRFFNKKPKSAPPTTA